MIWHGRRYNWVYINHSLYFELNSRLQQMDHLKKNVPIGTTTGTPTGETVIIVIVVPVCVASANNISTDIKYAQCISHAYSHYGKICVLTFS